MIGREDKPHAGEVSNSDFAELFEGRLKELQEGDIIKGKIVQITQDSVMIDIGYKSEGQVPLKEFLDKDGVPTVKVGDDVTVFIELPFGCEGRCDKPLSGEPGDQRGNGRSWRDRALSKLC